MDEQRGSTFLECLTGLGRTKGLDVSQENQGCEQLPPGTGVSGHRAESCGSPHPPWGGGREAGMLFHIDWIQIVRHLEHPHPDARGLLAQVG